MIVPNPIVGAAFGAVRHVCGRTNLSTCIANANESVADGYQDYNSTTGVSGRTCALGNATACATRGIQFVGEPIDPEIGPPARSLSRSREFEALTDPTTIVDPELVQEMMETAADQGNYYDARGETCWDIGSGTGGCRNSPWPAEGSDTIVYVVDGGDQV